MRLSQLDRDLIVGLIAEEAGPEAVVRLFGSRTRDDLRGGDVDLMVSLPHPVDRPAWFAARLAARLERALGGRKVDLVMQAPNLQEQPVHRVATSEGIVL